MIAWRKFLNDLYDGDRKSVERLRRSLQAEFDLDEIEKKRLAALAKIFKHQASMTNCPITRKLLLARSNLTSLQLKQIEDRQRSFT